MISISIGLWSLRDSELMYEAVHIRTTTVLSQSTCYLIPPGCPSKVAGSSKVESSSAEIPEISYFVKFSISGLKNLSTVDS